MAVAGPPAQYAVRPVQATQVPPVNLAHLRVAHMAPQEVPQEHAVPSTPGRAVVAASPTDSVSISSVPATPGRSGSGTIAAFQVQQRRPAPSAAGFSGGRLAPAGSQQDSMPLRSARERMPSPEAQGSLRLIGGNSQTGQSTGALLGPAAMAIAASTPILGRGSFGKPSSVNPSTPSPGMTHGPPLSARACASALNSSDSTLQRSSLLNGSSLNQLIARVQQTAQEREQELRRHLAEQKETEDLLVRSREELQQLLQVFSEVRDWHQSASEGGLPDLPLGPERPRIRAKPPFCWQPSQEYDKEFEVSGESSEIVTKMGDFEDQGWVIPVGGAWRLLRGGIYRWTIRIERKCTNRPQLQLGIHGANHSQPWRLVTTSRCSWSRDDEPWQDRPGGDRLIEEGSYVHVEVDMRGVNSKNGTFSMSINDGPFEQFFDDIPLGQPYPLIPVVSMGGNQSRVRLCPNY
mmetsp:Transcript_106931/g.190084  ORF Transcript_106931/g.190084 Transcript_106931/m.190084 type:complete len:462 (+) Transcript_106931:69-1454(+)